MRTLNLFVILVLLALPQFSSAQEHADSTMRHHAGSAIIDRHTQKPAPLVILKSDDRTMVVEPRNKETFDLESIEPNMIKSITVLKNDNAMVYGEKGKNGVLIIQFVDNYIFPKPIYKKIKPDN